MSFLVRTVLFSLIFVVSSHHSDACGGALIVFFLGFPDLKSFNNRFTETFGRRPAEYRSQVSPHQTVKNIRQMNYLDPSQPLVQAKLDAYTRLAADGMGM